MPAQIGRGVQDTVLIWSISHDANRQTIENFLEGRQCWLLAAAFESLLGRRKALRGYLQNQSKNHGN